MTCVGPNLGPSFGAARKGKILQQAQGSGGGLSPSPCNSRQSVHGFDRGSRSPSSHGPRRPRTVNQNDRSIHPLPAALPVTPWKKVLPSDDHFEPLTPTELPIYGSDRASKAHVHCRRGRLNEGISITSQFYELLTTLAQGPLATINQERR